MATKGKGKAMTSAPKAGITKMEAVRRAFAHFGSDAKPSEMQPWIKQQFGLDMTTDHISTYKGEISNKSQQAGKTKPTAKKPAAPAAAVTKPAPKPAAITQTPRRAGGDIILLDIEAVKGLVHRVGAEQLRALVDLLAK